MALSLTLYGCEINTRFTTVSSYSSWVILDLIRCLFLDTFALHWNMLTKEERRCVRKILSTPEGISKRNRLKQLIFYPITNLLIRLLNPSRFENEVKIEIQLFLTVISFLIKNTWIFNFFSEIECTLVCVFVSSIQPKAKITKHRKNPWKRKLKKFLIFFENYQ